MDILIVDDDNYTAELLKTLIGLWGCHADIALDGETALRMFHENNFQMVLLDMFLPDADGCSLIPDFKRHRPDVFIVAMTGYNTRELELRVRKSGILCYMSKPIEIADLKSIIDYTLQMPSNDQTG